MRLIDADALIQDLNDHNIPFNADINEAIIVAPTVDAVPVVRCKDCEDWTTWNDPTGTQSNYCPILDYWTKGEFYCAHGERREDAN